MGGKVSAPLDVLSRQFKTLKTNALSIQSQTTRSHLAHRPQPHRNDGEDEGGREDGKDP